MGFLRRLRLPAAMPLSAFMGDPNQTATGAASLTLVSSRDGDGLGNRTPFFVHVSAAGLAAPGYAEPYQNSMIWWDFGDASGTETVTDARTNTTVNLNTCQIGGEAAYVYRTAGTYTVTCYVAVVISGAVQIFSFTKSFTVVAYSAGSPTVQFVSFANGNDSWDGTSGTFVSGTTGPKKTISAINSALIDNCDVRLERGSVWSGTTGIDMNQGVRTSGMRLSAYGSGANPKIQITGGSSQGLRLDNGGGSTGQDKKDVVISNIDYENTGAPNASCIGAAATADQSHTGQLRAIFFDNCNSIMTYDQHYTVTDTFTGSIASGGVLSVSGSGNNIGLNQDLVYSGFPQGIRIVSQLTGAGDLGGGLYGDGTFQLNATGVSAGVVSARSMTSNKVGVIIANVGSPVDFDLATAMGFWKCSFVNSVTSKTIAMGILGGLWNWYFDVGNYFVGAGTDSTYDHHRYIDGKNKQLLALNRFGATGTGDYQRNMCINGNWDGVYGDNTDHQFPQWWNISQNYFSGTIWGFDLGNRLNNFNLSDSTVQFVDAVVDGNFFDGVGGHLFGCGKSVTIRNNRQINSVQLHGPAGSLSQISTAQQCKTLYAKVYRNRCHIPASAPGGAIMNLPEHTWQPNSKHEITDNILVDLRSSGGGVMNMYFSDQAACGSLIDRNTIYAPNNTGSVVTDGTAGARTWAQYQALAGNPDVNGNQTNPGWPSTPSQWSDLN